MAKEKSCVWRQSRRLDGYLMCDADTGCGHHVNQQPSNAMNYLDPRYMGKDNEWKYCMFCGDRIEVKGKLLRD